MNSRVLALSVLSVLTATSIEASATTIYDSYTGNPGVYYDGYYPVAEEAATTIAQEFETGAYAIQTIQLALTADDIADGGSINVYLVPASNSIFDLNAPLSLAGLDPIATIADASLTATGPAPDSNGLSAWPTAAQLTTVTLSAAVSASLAPNTEYFVLVSDLPTSGSSFQWWYGANYIGLGITDQLGANDVGGWSTVDASAVPFDNSIGQVGEYGLIVSDVPEPATLSILGFGAVALSVHRRRKSV